MVFKETGFMSHKNLFAAAFALFLVPLVGQAQVTLTIELKKETKGTTTKEVKNSTEVEKINVYHNNGTIEGTFKTTVLNSVYQQTVLEKPDAEKKATALKRTYEKAVVNAQKGRQVLPYQGKTILIEKKYDKYHFTYEDGGEITGDDATWLEKEFNKDAPENEFDFKKHLLPAKAVAVGESWTLNMPELLKDMEKTTKMAGDPRTAKGTGKLVKAYKKDGRQYGNLLFKLAIPIKSATQQDKEIKFQPGSVLKLDWTLSVCIDGTAIDGKSAISVQFNGAANVPADNPQARMEIASRTNGDETTQEVAKKD